MSLKWRSLDKFNHDVWQSDAGHRIARTWIGDRERYCAFSPETPEEEFRRQLREQYPVGCAVPTRSRIIGCYDSLDEAKAACRPHLPMGDKAVRC